MSHEKLHVRRLFCVRQPCPRGRLGFRSQRDLEAHTKTYHEEGGILVPPRVRANPPQINKRIQSEEDSAPNSVKISHPELSKKVSYPKGDKLELHFGETMTDEFRHHLIPIRNGAKIDSVIMLNKNQEPRSVDVDHVLTVEHGGFSLIPALDISPDDTLIAVGLYGFVEILDLNSGETLYGFAVEQPPINSVRFSPDGQLVAFSTSCDLRVRADLR